MTRLTLIIITFITFVFATSCKNDGRSNFSLTIKHYAGAAGLTLIYQLDENGLQIDTNCDLENCKQKTIYSRAFSRSESDSILSFLNSLQLDTLKPLYQTKGVWDGLVTRLKFRKSLFSSQLSTFENFNTPTTDTLFKFVDNLIPPKKYRFYTWGQDS
jgi:hypothetical protein